MPQMSGDELARQLRHAKRIPNRAGAEWQRDDTILLQAPVTMVLAARLNG